MSVAAAARYDTKIIISSQAGRANAFPRICVCFSVCTIYCSIVYNIICTYAQACNVLRNLARTRVSKLCTRAPHHQPQIYNNDNANARARDVDNDDADDDDKPISM